jgi:hypothetical protein
VPKVTRNNKPLPTIAGPGRPAIYPWRQLRTDKRDSFLVLGGDIHVISGLASASAKRIGNGCRFTCRTEEGGVRVWRVS